VVEVRIGIVSPYSLTVPGGVQAQVLGLARALNDQGHRARVLGPCDGPPPETGITPLGASIPTFANGSIAPIAPDIACTLRTIRALADEQFDVIHLHEPICPGPCQTALFTSYAPIVATWHAAGGSKAYMTPGVRWLASRATIRAAVSNDACDMARDALGGEYEVVFNGIDLDGVRKADPLLAAAPTIAYVGRHEPRKGLAVLLEALQQLPATVRLWVMSEGPQTAELKAAYAHDQRIEWLGSVSDEEKLARIKGADVFCVPSLRGESFGVVLLEGMAARTPVVASDLPGYRNVASTGTEALLVPPGDAAALAAALSDVLGNPHRAAALVAAGEPRAEQFAMDRLATTYVDMYERAIELAAARGTVRPVGRGRLRPLLRRRAEEWTGPSVAAARAPAR
jgi:phosphatidylinositol alpha-mannosyltransferase